MKTYQEFVSEAKKCWPGYKKKGTQKLFGKTYNRCVKAEEVELEESSTGERSGRRTRGKLTLARGRGADMDRKERTTAAIAKKAGLKGTGKYSTKDLRTKAKIIQLMIVKILKMIMVAPSRTITSALTLLQEKQQRGSI